MLCRPQLVTENSCYSQNVFEKRPIEKCWFTLACPCKPSWTFASEWERQGRHFSIGLKKAPAFSFHRAKCSLRLSPKPCVAQAEPSVWASSIHWWCSQFGSCQVAGNGKEGTWCAFLTELAAACHGQSLTNPHFACSKWAGSKLEAAVRLLLPRHHAPLGSQQPSAHPVHHPLCPGLYRNQVAKDTCCGTFNVRGFPGNATGCTIRSQETSAWLARLLEVSDDSW